MPNWYMMMQKIFTQPACRVFSDHKESVHKESVHKKFDIVFLDPPFNQHLVPVFCELLQQSQCLSDKALIYIRSWKKYAITTFAW